MSETPFNSLPELSKRNNQWDFSLKTRCPSNHRYDFVFPEHDFAYLGVPKCGSVMMRNAMKAGRQMGRERARKMQTRFAIIRHPTNRLVSAWRYAWSRVPFPEFWEHVKRDLAWDFHTKPYTDILGEDFTDIVRLEDITQWWPMYHARFPSLFPAEPQWLNATSAENEVPNVAMPFLQDIIDTYRADLQLWHRVAWRKDVGRAPK